MFIILSKFLLAIRLRRPLVPEGHLRIAWRFSCVPPGLTICDGFPSAALINANGMLKRLLGMHVVLRLFNFSTFQLSSGPDYVSQAPAAFKMN